MKLFRSNQGFLEDSRSQRNEFFNGLMSVGSVDQTNATPSNSNGKQPDLSWALSKVAAVNTAFECVWRNVNLQQLKRAQRPA